MKHPFWIVNSSLLFLVIFAFVFVYFSRIALPEREEIESVYITSKKDRKLDINIQKIYKNDLFETYQTEFIPQQQDLKILFPSPPSRHITTMPDIPAPEFLDPLDITLKGIIVVSSNDIKNRAIISDNKTKREDTYKVGNSIEGAQLIRIFRNKVTFLRSNGQQEILYLREQDAQFDSVYAAIDTWETIINKIGENNYGINVKEFTNRVTNLAQFIDILNLTVVYQKGKSIGCRIGNSKEKSLTQYLGLQKNDIILTINNIPADNSSNRITIYNDIIKTQLNDNIIVKLLRNKQEKIITFTLQETKKTTLDKTKSIQKTDTSKEITQEKQTILEKKHTFAPTIKEIRARERHNMFETGKAPSYIENEQKNE